MGNPGIHIARKEKRYASLAWKWNCNRNTDMRLLPGRPFDMEGPQKRRPLQRKLRKLQQMRPAARALIK